MIVLSGTAQHSKQQSTTLGNIARSSQRTQLPAMASCRLVPVSRTAEGRQRPQIWDSSPKHRHLAWGCIALRRSDLRLSTWRRSQGSKDRLRSGCIFDSNSFCPGASCFCSNTRGKVQWGARPEVMMYHSRHMHDSERRQHRATLYYL